MQKEKQESTHKKATKKYNLLDFKIQVFYVDCDTVEDRWVFGHTEFNGNKIKIYISTKNRDGGEFTEQELNVTLRHELFHVILAKLYFSGETDETLIEWLAQATSILHKQGLTI